MLAGEAAAKPLKPVRFVCNDWLPTAERGQLSTVQLYPSLLREGTDRMRWIVKTQTGNCKNGGTDATVLVTLLGDSVHSSESIELETPTTSQHRRFVQGHVCSLRIRSPIVVQNDRCPSAIDAVGVQIDEFVVDTCEMTAVSSVRVELSGDHSGSGWFLDWLSVRRQSDSDDRTCWFGCYRWFHPSLHGGQLVRGLQPSAAIANYEVASPTSLPPRSAPSLPPLH